MQNAVSEFRVQNVWSLVKRSIMEYHHKLSVKHLNAYLDELEWQFNNWGNRTFSGIRFENYWRLSGWPRTAGAIAARRPAAATPELQPTPRHGKGRAPHWWAF